MRRRVLPRGRWRVQTEKAKAAAAPLTALSQQHLVRRNKRSLKLTQARQRLLLAGLLHVRLGVDSLAPPILDLHELIQQALIARQSRSTGTHLHKYAAPTAAAAAAAAAAARRRRPAGRSARKVTTAHLFAPRCGRLAREVNGEDVKGQLQTWGNVKARQCAVEADAALVVRHKCGGRRDTFAWECHPQRVAAYDGVIQLGWRATREAQAPEGISFRGIRRPEQAHVRISRSS